MVNHAPPSRQGKVSPFSSGQVAVAEFTQMIRLMTGAVLATAVAFAWTGWNLFQGPRMGVAISVGVDVAVAGLCLASWFVAARAMIHCRRAALRDAAFAETEERLRKERNLLRTIINHLPDHIYAKDREGRFVFNNEAHSRTFGVASPRDLVGKSDRDFFAAEQAAQFLADERRIVDSEQPLLNQEQFNPPIHGEPARRWYSASKVLWRGGEGEVLGTVGITRDIHEQKQAGEKMREILTQLERSNRELQDFAYVASHDLQEPLRKIVVFGERLRERNAEALSPEGLDYLQRMQKAAARMQTLINDLLAFSRITTKAKPFAPVNLAEIAAEVIVDLEGRIEQVGGRVEVGPLPTIDADSLQMRQLLQNLIGNALKFRRPEVPPLVRVQAELIASPKDETLQLCQLSVSDNGIGFDEKYLDRIFNVFQRLHARAEYEGTGMGLAITRKIAFHHGGEITATSKPGEGATFIVTLPCQQRKCSAEETILS